MSIVPSLLQINQKFVESKQYEMYITDKFPDKKVAILTCTDTRLDELLLKAMGFKNGDVKFIKNAGAIITQPFGSIMRSILVAVYELNAQEVLVVGHPDCSITQLHTERIVSQFIEQGVDPLAIETLEHAGIRMDKFLRGFATAEEGIMHSVKMIRRHPLFPPLIPVHGLIMDTNTGALEVLAEDYREP